MSAQQTIAAARPGPVNPAAAPGASLGGSGSTPDSEAPEGLFSAILTMFGNNVAAPVAPKEPLPATTPPGVPLAASQNWLDFRKPDPALSLSAQSIEMAQGEQSFTAIPGIQSPALQLAGIAAPSVPGTPVPVTEAIANATAISAATAGNVAAPSAPETLPGTQQSQTGTQIVAAVVEGQSAATPITPPMPGTTNIGAANISAETVQLAATNTPAAPDATLPLEFAATKATRTDSAFPPQQVATADNPVARPLAGAETVQLAATNTPSLPDTAQPGENMPARSKEAPPASLPPLEFVATRATRTVLALPPQSAARTETIQIAQLNKPVIPGAAQLPESASSPTNPAPPTNTAGALNSQTAAPATLSQALAAAPQVKSMLARGAENQKPDLAADLQRLLGPLNQRPAIAIQPAPGPANSASPASPFQPGGTEPNFPGTAQPGSNSPTLIAAALLAGRTGSPTANTAAAGDPLLQTQAATPSTSLPGQISASGPFNPALANAAQNAYQQPQINLPAVAFQIIRNFNNGNNRFQIRIDPPELGRIDVRLNVDDKGSLNARLIVERPETLDLLQRDARALERALSQAGFEGSRTNLEFSLKQNPFAGDGRDTNQNTSDPGQIAASDDAPQDQAETINTAYRTAATPGGLSLWA